MIKEGAFEVKMEFKGFAAGFVAERIWSPDQQIQQLPDGKVLLSFSASSEPELAAWLLSFGDEARLLGPDWLVEKVAETVTRQFEAYVQKN